MYSKSFLFTFSSKTAHFILTMALLQWLFFALSNFYVSLCRRHQRHLDSLRIVKDLPCVWFGGAVGANHLSSSEVSLHFGSVFATFVAVAAHLAWMEKGVVTLDQIVLHSEKVDLLFRGFRLHSD